jgi:hypothetical protein
MLDIRSCLGVSRSSSLGFMVCLLFSFLTLSLQTDCFLNVEGSGVAFVTEVFVWGVFGIVDSNTGAMLPY